MDFSFNYNYIIFIVSNPMKKYYYENVLANQNYVAKPNSVWVADITSFELDENKKKYNY